MSSTSVHPVSGLLDIWSKLENKNKDLMADIFVDKETIDLLSPFCSTIEKYKGMYISGLKLGMSCGKQPDVSFVFSALPRNPSFESHKENFV